MAVASKGHIFLVGCPRSGTTLLQSLLAAHPEIASFPESHFFAKLVPEYEPRRLALGMGSKRARPRFEEFLHEMGRDEMSKYLPWFALFMSQYVQSFVKVLDTLTQEQGKSLWLEKTPRHLHYIDSIEKLVKGAKFIHIIRNGADVVASLYEVTNQHSKKVWRGGLNIEQCIEEWIKSIEASRRYLNNPNHAFVRYEYLVEDAQTVLIKLCDFLGINFTEAMLRDYRQVAKQVILQRETWKASVSGDIQNANAKKFYELFDEEQRQFILEQVAQVALSDFT